MGDKQRVLTSLEAQAFYDSFGKKQDSQSFYEDPALDDLIAHAKFQDAKKVFEFGCGTGKFAALLLKKHLPPSTTYIGCDISPVMVGIATQRLEKYPDRAKVVQTGIAVHFPISDHSVDCVISSYVLDLLSEGDIRTVFTEAHRVLMPGGKFCLVSLTKGNTLLSRIVSSLWMSVFHIRASFVGGCRPILLDPYIDRYCWELDHRRVLAPFGVPSEVLVLIATREDNKAIEPKT